MQAVHKRQINFGNPVRNLVGQPHYVRKPSIRKILDALLSAMARSSNGTCWAPVEKVVDGKAVEWNLMLKQCPGACGHVWKLEIESDDVARWLVNEINQRRVVRAPGQQVREEKK